MYEPASGRFDGLDPYAGNSWDPQSYNKYLYTHADPVNNSDPTGEFSVSISVMSAMIGSGFMQAGSGMLVNAVNHFRPPDNVWVKKAQESIKWAKDTLPKDQFEMNRRITGAYAEMYLSNPAKFQWAGLAAFASFQVGIAMRKAKNIQEEAGNPVLAIGMMMMNVPTGTEMLQSLKQGNIGIFSDIYWQHMAYREKGISEIKSLHTQGQISDIMLEAWNAIDSGDSDKGNELIAYWEQGVVAEVYVYRPHRWMFSKTSDLTWYMPSQMPSPVPGAPPFLEVVPDGDIGNFNDRWKWITESMLPKWKQLLQNDPNLVNSQMQKFVEDKYKTDIP